MADRDKAWQEFKPIHHCKIVAHIDSEWIYTGRGMGRTSIKDGWLCDDGITYFKEQEKP